MTESHNADKLFVEAAFAEAQVLRAQLTDAVRQAAVAKNDPEARAALERAEELKNALREKIPAIRERISPFERLLTLKEQYETQRNLLDRVGILIPLKNGQRGIKTSEMPRKGFGRKSEILEIPFPTLSETTARLKEANIREQGEPKGFIERKIDQGLKRLRITPFGMPLLTLVDLYEKKLVEKFDAGTLAYTKQNPLDPNETTELIPQDKFDRDNPIYLSDEYKAGGKGADAAGTMVYHVQNFDPDPAKHKGKTKSEILIADPSRAWSITLAEESMHIPRASGNPKSIGGRTQLDTSGTQIHDYIEQGEPTPCPSEYLGAFHGTNEKNTIYRGERGQTTEEQLTDALLFLEETNQVLDDWKGKGSINWATSSYFPKSGDKGRVPSFYWYRDFRQARLFWSVPVLRYGNCGVRSVAGA